MKDFVYERASKWSNLRIRKYLEQVG